MALTRYFADYAWLGGDQVADRVLLEVAGDRIGAVRVGVDRPVDAVHLAGVTVPGMANAHCHAFHRALRGRTHRGAGMFWTWRADMYGIAARLTPDSYHALARALYAEMALAGISCVGEFHYVHHGRAGPRTATATRWVTRSSPRRGTPGSVSPCSTPATWPAESAHRSRARNCASVLPGCLRAHPRATACGPACAWPTVVGGPRDAPGSGRHRRAFGVRNGRQIVAERRHTLLGDVPAALDAAIKVVLP